jgi:hypothetical protein
MLGSLGLSRQEGKTQSSKKDKGMTVSEAMREGSKNTKQSFGILVDAGGGYACALGAIAIGAKIKDPNYYEINKAFPVLDKSFGSVCGCSFLTSSDRLLYKQIFHMNDTHGWSRETIANIVDAVVNGEKPNLPKVKFSSSPYQLQTSKIQLSQQQFKFGFDASYINYYNNIQNLVNVAYTHIPYPQLSEPKKEEPKEDSINEEFNKVANDAMFVLSES